MQWVLLAACGIGLSTVAGTGVGFAFKNISQRAYNCIIGFAAGVMLCAAVCGLVEPSVEGVGGLGAILATAGIFLGALFLFGVDKLTPKLNAAIGISGEVQGRVVLLVAAIAIHHLPEGVAAGVSFGSDNINDIIIVCGGIAIQNLPEAAVIIAPMLNSGVSKKKALLIALMSGGVEIIGTFIGYLAVNVAVAIMPFALAFAGGSMMYIIIDEMIPQTHTQKFGGCASFSTLGGFCLMLLLDTLLSGI